MPFFFFANFLCGRSKSLTRFIQNIPTFDHNVALHLEYGTRGAVGRSCLSPYRHTQLLLTQQLSNGALALNKVLKIKFQALLF